MNMNDRATAYVPAETGEPVCRCQNCNWTGVIGLVNPIEDFFVFERVAPGEICPAGDCPECGAVAHIDPPRYYAVPELIERVRAANLKLQSVIERTERLFKAQKATKASPSLCHGCEYENGDDEAAARACSACERVGMED